MTKHNHTVEVKIPQWTNKPSLFKLKCSKTYMETWKLKLEETYNQIPQLHRTN